MKINFTLAFILLIAFFGVLRAQESFFVPTEEIEKKYAPYVMIGHQNLTVFEEFKKSDRPKYLKELWYYSQSFYIRRNVFEKGVEMNDAIICISRYENLRKEKEEAVVTIPGFKDVLVLLPTNKLIYKP